MSWAVGLAVDLVGLLAVVLGCCRVVGLLGSSPPTCHRYKKDATCRFLFFFLFFCVRINGWQNPPPPPRYEGIIDEHMSIAAILIFRDIQSLLSTPATEFWQALGSGIELE